MRGKPARSTARCPGLARADLPPAFSCRIGLPCHRRRPLSSPRPGSRSGRLRRRPTPSFLGRPADWPALKSRLRGGRETGGVSIATFLGLWLEISASDSSMTLSPTDPFIQQISTELEPGLGPGAAATSAAQAGGLENVGGCARGLLAAGTGGRSAHLLAPASAWCFAHPFAASQSFHTIVHLKNEPTL